MGRGILPTIWVRIAGLIGLAQHVIVSPALAVWVLFFLVNYPPGLVKRCIYIYNTFVLFLSLLYMVAM